MAWIYRYIDKNDGAVKYIGMTTRGDRLLPRIQEHEWRDKWTLDQYDVEVASTHTRCDAEMLEAHYIAAYQTGKYFNKAKTDWGLCSYAPDPRFTTWYSLDQLKDEMIRNYLIKGGDIEMVPILRGKSIWDLGLKQKIN